MPALRRIRDAVVRYGLRPLSQGLMTLGGIDLHLAARRAEALDRYRELGYAPPLLPLPYGPPAGHPERLCPELPLSSEELALLRQLAPQGRR